MSDLTGDLFHLILDLMPGFVAAWIVYGLTPYKKESQFERVIQAFIFTAAVRVIFWIIQTTAFTIGGWKSLGVWKSDFDQTLAFLLGILLGLALSGFANNNKVVAWLYDHGFTRSNGYVSEWFATFRRKRCYVILQLKNGKRLQGWPKEYPDGHERGHFVLSEPCWLTPTRRVELPGVDLMLLPADQVEHVQFLTPRRPEVQPATRPRLWVLLTLVGMINYLLSRSRGNSQLKVKRHV